MRRLRGLLRLGGSLYGIQCDETGLGILVVDLIKQF